MPQNMSINQAMGAIGETLIYDPNKGLVTQSGRFSFAPGTYTQDASGNYFMSDPGALGAMIASAPLPKFDQTYIDSASKVYDPQKQALAERNQMLLQTANTNAEVGRAKAKSSYDLGLKNQEVEKGESLDTMRAQIGGRNASTSGAGNRSVRKLEEWDDEQIARLAAAYGTNVADIERQLSESQADIISKGKLADAEILQNIYNLARSNYDTESSQMSNRQTNTSNYLIGLAEANRREREAEVEFERQQKLARMSASRSGGGGGSKDTTEARLQWIEEEATKRAGKDPRLDEGEFNYAQLLDAHRLDLLNQFGLGRYYVDSRPKINDNPKLNSYTKLGSFGKNNFSNGLYTPSYLR